MIAALEKSRFGFAFVGRDPARTAVLAHRRDALKSAGRWTTAVMVWIGFQFARAVGATLFLALAADGWSTSVGPLDNLFELGVWSVATAVGLALVYFAPRLGLSLAHYGSLVALGIIASRWESFVRLGLAGESGTDVTLPSFFVVLAVLSGFALWKTNVAKGSFGPARAHDRVE